MLKPSGFARDPKSSDDLLYAIYHYTRLRRILQWTQVYIHCEPGQISPLELAKECYVVLHMYLMWVLEYVACKLDPYWLLLLGGIILDDITHMKALDCVDAVTATNLATNVLSQIKFLVVVRLNRKKSFGRLPEDDQSLLISLGCCGSIQSSLAPAHRLPDQVWKDIQYGYLQFEVDPPSTRCLRLLCHQNNYERNAERNDGVECHCNWVMACIPQGLLTILGFRSQNIHKIFLHDPGSEIGTELYRLLFAFIFKPQDCRAEMIHRFRYLMYCMYLVVESLLNYFESVSREKALGSRGLARLLIRFLEQSSNVISRVLAFIDSRATKSRNLTREQIWTELIISPPPIEPADWERYADDR
jgi:hypothetical protein